MSYQMLKQKSTLVYEHGVDYLSGHVFYRRLAHNAFEIKFKGKLSDSFTNYNYVGNTKVSVSIKKT